MVESLESRIAQRALSYVTDPPSGLDPVVELASPEQLQESFGRVVELGFDAQAATHDDDALLAAVDLVLKHSVHTSHPRFVNQNFAGPDPLAVVGDWLGAALNTTGATFEAAPVFTLMESAVLSKLGRIAGYLNETAEPLPTLPPGLFCPGGSTATLYALQLARHRIRPDVRRTGSTGEQLTLFVSDAGHYAASKSAALLGLGTDSVIKVESDDGGAIVPAALDDAIGASLESGQVPFAIIGTSGTTVTSAFDDLDALADIAQRYDLWLHVDGCYGGSALFSPAEFDTGDRTFQCARRIDVLKLWLAWKHHGDAGFAARVDHAVAMANYTRERIAASDGEFVEVAGQFTNVVFVWVPCELRPLGPVASLPPETRNALHALAPKIKARMQAEGTAMIGFQPIGGMNTFRLLYMNPAVTETDVDALLDRVAEYGRAAGQD